MIPCLGPVNLKLNQVFFNLFLFECLRLQIIKRHRQIRILPKGQDTFGDSFVTDLNLKRNWSRFPTAAQLSGDSRHDAAPVTACTVSVVQWHSSNWLAEWLIFTIKNARYNRVYIYKWRLFKKNKTIYNHRTLKSQWHIVVCVCIDKICQSVMALCCPDHSCAEATRHIPQRLSASCRATVWVTLLSIGCQHRDIKSKGLRDRGWKVLFFFFKSFEVDDDSQLISIQLSVRGHQSERAAGCLCLLYPEWQKESSCTDRSMKNISPYQRAQSNKKSFTQIYLPLRVWLSSFSYDPQDTLKSKPVLCIQIPMLMHATQHAQSSAQRRQAQFVLTRCISEFFFDAGTYKKKKESVLPEVSCSLKRAWWCEGCGFCSVSLGTSGSFRARVDLTAPNTPLVIRQRVKPLSTGGNVKRCANLFVQCSSAGVQGWARWPPLQFQLIAQCQGL